MASTSLWEPVELSFEGPDTSEVAAENPFLNIRMLVAFSHPSGRVWVRGFYAADGNAGETGADSGSVWKVRFTPPATGLWIYEAKFHRGEHISLSPDPDVGELLVLDGVYSGSFHVTEESDPGAGFYTTGPLETHDGYFRFKDSGKCWLKGGANSPENLLAFVDFDATYRIQAESREGEAAVAEEIHKYESHLKDWSVGDPTWGGGRGKALVGAVNYLAEKGMNSIYFLTMNIGGDGKDVWPYRNPDDFSRFDVSKLAQWNVLFQHMQRKGILLHMVLQETENERLLDDGDTGFHRQLYYLELISRFGHHPGLVWNLGEENGPTHWSPVGQNDRQREDMARFMRERDPHQNPVVIHTHAYEPVRTDILTPLLGFEPLSGISLQVDHRTQAPDIVWDWREQSRETGVPWVVTMDEIGMWYTGARTDAEDPEHTSLRRYALWGCLLSGAGGVEWYFGARHPHNDLGSEDWRQRDRLWELTRIAMDFFEEHLPYWEMRPVFDAVERGEGFAMGKEDVLLAAYLFGGGANQVNIPYPDYEYDVYWYDPLKGGALVVGGLEFIRGGDAVDLGEAPGSQEQDWMVLLRRKG